MVSMRTTPVMPRTVIAHSWALWLIWVDHAFVFISLLSELFSHKAYQLLSYLSELFNVKLRGYMEKPAVWRKIKLELQIPVLVWAAVIGPFHTVISGEATFRQVSPSQPRLWSQEDRCTRTTASMHRAPPSQQGPVQGVGQGGPPSEA